MASALVENISLNTEFCDEYEGEYTLQPSVLKMKDLKAGGGPHCMIFPLARG